MAANSTMIDVKNVGGSGVFLVNGDFIVNNNNVVSPGSFLMVVAKGKITFGPGVNAVAGIFIADGGIVASGTSASQLVIDGSLYSSQSGGDIRLNRGYISPSANNMSPAVLVRYRPDFLFNMPPKLMNIYH